MHVVGSVDQANRIFLRAIVSISHHRDARCESMNVVKHRRYPGRRGRCALTASGRRAGQPGGLHGAERPGFAATEFQKSFIAELTGIVVFPMLLSPPV